MRNSCIDFNKIIVSTISIKKVIVVQIAAFRDKSHKSMGFVAQTAWPSPPSRETLAE
jgi:hypothetical protein